MQFRSPAPGNLTLEGSTYYADWSVASDNFARHGFRGGGVGRGCLELSSGGFPQLGYPGKQKAVTSFSKWLRLYPVIRKNWGRPLERISGSGSSGRGVLRYMDLVTHEALHAFLYANHSPLGSDSVLEPLEDPGEEWLSDTDIAQIEAWLAGDFDGTRVWFPGDLPHYITRWVIPPRTKTRLVCTILEAAPVVIRAVCGTSHATLVGGTDQPFGIGMDLASEGFFSR